MSAGRITAVVDFFIVGHLAFCCGRGQGSCAGSRPAFGVLLVSHAIATGRRQMRQAGVLG